MKTQHLILLTIACTTTVQGAPRTSTNYTISPESTDGDGQNNRFEFTAGLVPNNPLSRFLLRVEPVAGQPAQKRVVFSPRFDGRSYNILTSTTLAAGSWTALTGGTVSDNGDERSVTDPNASGSKKFHRVQVVKP